MRLTSYLASATSIPGPLRHPAVRRVILETLRRPSPALWGAMIGCLGTFFGIFGDTYSVGQAFGIAVGCTVPIYLVASLVIALQHLPWRRH